MFFDFIKRNSRKLRNENGIYFASLIISVVAFYVILSLGEQDVMIYLKTIESEAVSKLLLMIPVIYVVSLFFVFSLIYFANRYQLQCRSHEFGIYLMMGMKRSRLFGMIMAETLWNGFVALIIGIPVSLFLTELISLTTSRLVGMGIIGHHFRISWEGLGLTVFGFITVQLFAMFILSFKMSRKEPFELLNEQKEKTQKIVSSVHGWVSFVLGTAFLCTAYVLAISYMRKLDYRIFALVILVGIIGTFMLFHGLGSFIGRWVRYRSSSSTGLFTFTGRQLQENVLHQWSTLAISSLLILMSMICFAYGISTALGQGDDGRTADFTFQGSEKEIVSVLTSDKLKTYIKNYYPMKLGMIKSADENSSDTSSHIFSWGEVKEAVSKENDLSGIESLKMQLSYSPYFISLSSYNKLLKSNNKAPIMLRSNEVAMYSNIEFSYSHDLLKNILKNHPAVSIKEKQYKLTSGLYTDNLVADRAITISYALIVPDNIYNTLIEKSEDDILYNMDLNNDFIHEKGLMQAMQQIEKLLSTTSVHYESYLASMGRQLFYMVAGSYTTFYLGVMFLIIANTVLGLKFLMQLRSTRRRYLTLSMLGASNKSMCSSARIQIWLYFGLVLFIALINSIFGVCSMLKAFLRIPNASTLTIKAVTLTSAVVIIIFIVFEIGYILMLQRKSDAEINKTYENK